MFVNTYISAKLIFHVTLNKRIWKFVKYLDDALKHLYKPKVELLICADINTDYLIESY